MARKPGAMLGFHPRRGRKMVVVPTFFVPHARDEAMAREVWQRLRDGHGSTDEKIFSLTWQHKGSTYDAEVGKDIARFPERAGEVIAIIRGNSCFMVFTTFRGTMFDVPIMVGDNEYIHHRQFADT